MVDTEGQVYAVEEGQDLWGTEWGDVGEGFEQAEGGRVYGLAL